MLFAGNCMPKKVPKIDLEVIKNVIGRYPEGIKLDELLQVTEIVILRRTLQRRLKSLVEEGYITILGKGAGCRYQICRSTAYAYGDVQIQLSNESQVIRNYVNQTLGKRKYVTYNRQFLYAYQPNKTNYLTPSILTHLKTIGSHPYANKIAGTYARKILNHLLIDLSWNSSRLEGNTYSLLETERLLEFDETPANKSTTDTQMLLNHKAAIEFLVNSAEALTFKPAIILNLHALLSDNLLSNAAACGRLRNIPVAIVKTTYSPLSILAVIDEMFQKILDVATKISEPFEQAFFVMVHLPYLQPFEDVNKRVSRLAANIPLINNNFSPLSFVDVPEQAYIDGILGVYELNNIALLRDIFVWAYERSAAKYSTARQVLGQADPFRLKYRQQLIEVIGEIISDCLNAQDSINYIKTWTERHIASSDWAHFREIIETELLNLHEGNIARFRLNSAQFAKWHRQYRKII